MAAGEGEVSHEQDKVKGNFMEGFLVWFSRNFTVIIVVFALICLLGALGFYFVAFSNGLSNKQAVWGQFGDFVGGMLNPIFGFTTIVILVVTLNLQRKELKEMRDTAVLNNTILEEQLKSARNNFLENTFLKH